MTQTELVRPDQVRPEARSTTGARVLVVWCPDWPVVAAMNEENLPSHLPVAVLDKGEIFACSPTARLDGVRRGMRRRDAASRCPELLLIDRNADRDVRAFDAVLSAIEEVSPGSSRYVRVCARCGCPVVSTVAKPRRQR